MFSLKYLLNWLDTHYIWVDVLFIKETPEAILIVFDGKEIWLPKAWILQVERNKGECLRGNKAISIKISQYHWVKKA